MSCGECVITSHCYAWYNYQFQVKCCVAVIGESVSQLLDPQSTTLKKGNVLPQDRDNHMVSLCKMNNTRNLNTVRESQSPRG